MCENLENLGDFRHCPHNYNQGYSTESAPGGSLEDPPAMIWDYCDKDKQTFDRAKCENLCYPALMAGQPPAQDLLSGPRTSIACVKTWKIMRLRHRTITTKGTVRRRLGGSLEDPPAMIWDYCDNDKQTFDRAKCENLCYPALMAGSLRHRTC